MAFFLTRDRSNKPNHGKLILWQSEDGKEMPTLAEDGHWACVDELDTLFIDEKDEKDFPRLDNGKMVRVVLTEYKPHGDRERPKCKA